MPLPGAAKIVQSGFAQGAADWRSGPRWSATSMLYLVHPFASSRHFPSRGNESVTEINLSAIWHDKHSGDWLTAFATPYPALPNFPPYAGGRIKL